MGNLNALKILHLSCHQGCINEFQQVAKELSLDLTSFYLLNQNVFLRLCDSPNPTYDILNMTHEKAEKIWKKNKEFFNSFDTIITSDTAPISRIFLQNDWKKPLIIWVCNRFDYHHEESAVGFPDEEYYNLMREAARNPYVFVASYTPFEYKYARKKKVDLGDRVIKPIGAVPHKLESSAFGSDLDRSRYIFLSQSGPAPLASEQKGRQEYIKKQCISRGIFVCDGRYNGPDDLVGFKGVLHFPYQASNLFLFENIQRGIVHFVPSEKFLAMAKESTEPYMPCKATKYWLDSFQDSEWYLPENKDLFVYFDSWDDLAHKINTLDYETQRKKILLIGNQHRITMLTRWKQIFSQIESIIS
jgi:hypothetical protein